MPVKKVMHLASKNSLTKSMLKSLLTSVWLWVFLVVASTVYGQDTYSEFPDNYEPVEKAEVEKIKKSEEYWYVDKPLKKHEMKLRTKPDPLDSGFAQLLGSIFQVLFYIIIAAAIGAVLYFLYKNADFFNKTITTEVEAIPLEIESEEDLQNLPYPTLIEKAKNEGDFRLAARWYYLYVLKELSLKDRISFSKFRTNNEYKDQIAQLIGREHALTHKFKEVVKIYEYTWFGGFDVAETQFLGIENKFKEALTLI